MNKQYYDKPPLTYLEQVDRLKSRGLIINSEEKAIHLLENISYFRLSGYWYPLLSDKQMHVFKPGANLETAFRIYCFDRELRKVILSEIEKIEIAIRAKMIYIMSHSQGPFWLEHPELFYNSVLHQNTLTKIRNEFERCDEEFITAFKNKYSNSFPPNWMLLEIASFGSLSILYHNLKPGTDKRAIAHYFGLADSIFGTWLHSIVYLRNICAHHSRVWNRVLSISPSFPRKPHKQWIINTQVPNNRMYFTLSIIGYLLQTINPKHTFPQKVNDLFARYPIVDIKAMGFPEDWRLEPLWRC
jgi:abortive infection bacteriophage resistance protein